MKCKLCNKDSDLRDSHIIPESLYKPLYDDKHRAIQISNPNGIGKKNKREFLQKGIREKLLCDDCEQLLNDRYEKYFKKLWFDDKVLPETMDEDSSIRLKHIDYHKFKLFHLSVLFRAAVSTLPQFQQVNLGPHENKLRDIIKNDTFVPDDKYVILCHTLTKNKSEIQYGLITNPFKLRQPNGYISYGFCFGGCVWYYVIDSRKTNLFTSFMLNSYGELGIMPMAWEKFMNL
jgi:hypothetical protein